MTQRFLILRCHPRDTLSIPSAFPSLNLLCPTTSIQVRRGPSRARSQLTIPILPSFLFMPDTPSYVQLEAPYIPPQLRSKLHMMHRPLSNLTHPHVFDEQNPLPTKIPRQRPTSLAYCTLSEITRMTAPSLPIATELQCGSRVEVLDGLVQGIIGTVQLIRQNGDITLKVQQHLGWQINTCIVNASVLRCL